MIGTRRSTPHSRANAAPKFHVFGGLQACVDLQRAFDCVNRAKLFTRLWQLNIDESIIQLLTAWHQDTQYIVQHDLCDSPISIGRGVRQGCKAAPGLWTFFMVLFLHDLMAFIPMSWICDHLNIYADDLHVGAEFTCLEDFEKTRFAIGVMFQTLASLDMIINPQKSVVIMKVKGPGSKTLLQRCVGHDQNGKFLKIELPHDVMFCVPIQQKTKYLGIIISYDNFEMESLRHRLTLMHVGFQRLKRWLTGRHNLSLKRRVQLWKTCVYPILSYGICATGLTHIGIRLAITQMTKMLRMIFQDHSYVTHRTHQQVFQRHHVASPAELLHDTVTGLLASVTQRYAKVDQHDLVRTISWDHLHDILTQLQAIQTSIRATEHPTPADLPEASLTPCFSCTLCEFQTSHASVFRRHCTISHGLRIFRTQPALTASYAVDGLPECKFCGMVFTTWRTFQHHIERGCQVLLGGPAQCTANLRGTTPMLPGDRSRPHASDLGMRGTRMLTPTELEHLKTLNFGLRLLRVIKRKEWHTVADDDEACAYLRTRCVLCAQHFTRIQDLQQHYRQQHSDLWEHVPLKAQQLTNIYSNDPPCGVCGALFRTHTCPVWTQIAMLLVNGACLDSEEADLETRCRCDICGECFETPAILTQHLQQLHGLHGMTFNASRDAIDNSAACAHCGQTFTAMSSLKTHIVQGKCVHFNPMASAETKPVDELWKAACLRGQLYEVLTPAHNRLHLTLHCQCCPRIFMRANDLALHLQSAHSRLWRRAQRLTLLLVDAFYSQNACCCNPSTGVKRGNHVCLPLRQLAMAFHRLQQEPFAPTMIGKRQLQATLSPKLPAAQRFLLEQLLTNGQLQALWTEEGVLQILRACCLYCGVSLAPADLSVHLREEHQCHHELYMFYLDQLQDVVLEVTPDIYQCPLCTQIFNLPWIHKPDEPADDRMALAQSHLRGHCPVLVNLALLFSYLFHGEWIACTRNASAGSLSADSGRIQQPGTSLSRQHLDAGAQSAGDQDTPQGPATKTRRPAQKQRHRATGDHGANQTTPGSCPPGHQARSRTPKHAQTGSIHSFFEQRSNRCISPDAPRDCQLEEVDGQPNSGATSAETAPDPLPGEVSSTAGGTDCQRAGDGPTLPGVTTEIYRKD